MTDSTLLVDVGDHWQIAIQGAVVDQCCFDYAVVLRLSQAPSTWELRIEQPFVLTTSEGAEHLVLPEELAHLHVILTTLRSTVESLVAFKDGRLDLRLDDHAIIEVPPNEGFEAWTLTGPDGIRVISMPGGEVAVWNS